MELDESQAGDPSQLPEGVYEWAADQVYRLSKEHGAKPEGFWENAQAFSAAVDWSEKWIQGLIAFHIILWLLVLLLRKNMTVQGVIFLSACFLMAITEPVNTALRERYWSIFSRGNHFDERGASANYFDERGAFAVVMFTGPLILLCVIQLFIFLFAAADMLVQVKRAELRRKKKLAAKEQ